MKEIVFRYPEYLTIITLFVLIGMWKLQVKKYWVRPPAPTLLSRHIQTRKEQRIFSGWKIRELILAALAIVTLLSAATVLSVPVEKMRETRTVVERRDGICVFDVSGSTLGPAHNIMVEAFIRFARNWLKRFPQDYLGCIGFADMATPLGRQTSDPEVLARYLQNMNKLSTNYGGGTHLERGIFSAVMALTDEWTPAEADKVEMVLRMGPGKFEEVKKYLAPELSRCRSRGKFMLIFTDGLVELNPSDGMAPSLVLLELAGECGIMPFFITTDDPAGGYQEVRKKLADTVKKFGGKDYYVRNLNTDINAVNDTIALRIPPAKRDAREFVSERKIGEFLVRIALTAILVWIAIFLWKQRKTLPL